ncbi:hypothetical protein DFJ74DRAFT_685648 [Hyaloraphidium curvatum]|nr:hypothetical protein DFJ74DRAFT_685648 [Hyaloraphidium curvatum]
MPCLLPFPSAVGLSKVPSSVCPSHRPRSAPPRQPGLVTPINSTVPGNPNERAMADPGPAALLSAAAARLFAGAFGAPAAPPPAGEPANTAHPLTAPPSPPPSPPPRAEAPLLPLPETRSAPTGAVAAALLDPVWWVAAANQAMFLLSGAGISLVSQELYYSGSADEWSMLVVLTQYLGMVAAYFLPATLDAAYVVSALSSLLSDAPPDRPRSPPRDPSPDKAQLTSPKYHGPAAARTLFPPAHLLPQVLLLSFLDILANTLVTVGIFVAGAGLHQVVYGAVVPLTAVLSGWLGRRRMLGRRRWAAVLAVAVGMGMSGWQSGEFQWAGVLLNLGGTVAYAFVAALTEKIFADASPEDLPPHSGPPPPTPMEVCTWVGSTSCLLLFAWISFYTLPRWDGLVAGPVRERGTHAVPFILALYALLTLLHFSLNLSYYTLLHSMGAVSTNVLNGLSAAVVLVGGHAWFCSRDGSQCLDAAKVVGCAVVAGGCVMYAVGAPDGAGRAREAEGGLVGH